MCLCCPQAHTHTAKQHVDMRSRRPHACVHQGACPYTAGRRCSQWTYPICTKRATTPHPFLLAAAGAHTSRFTSNDPGGDPCHNKLCNTFVTQNCQGLLQQGLAASLLSWSWCWLSNNINKQQHDMVLACCSHRLSTSSRLEQQQAAAGCQMRRHQQELIFTGEASKRRYMAALGTNKKQLSTSCVCLRGCVHVFGSGGCVVLKLDVQKTTSPLHTRSPLLSLLLVVQQQQVPQQIAANCTHTL